MRIRNIACFLLLILPMFIWAQEPQDSILVQDANGNIYRVPANNSNQTNAEELMRSVFAPKTSAPVPKAKNEKGEGQEDGTEDLSLVKRRRMQRIDREVMQTTFVPKGQWLLGGTISYSEHNQENLNFLVLKDVEGEGYSFSFSPYFGYFIRNNIALGMRYNYKRTYLDLGNFDLNLGEDFNISLKDLYWLEHKHEVSAFMRTYMPVGRSKIFGFFNELRLTYGYSTGKNSTGSGTEYDGTFERTHSAQIGCAPGLTAFIMDFAAVEVSVGVMGYSVKWVDQWTNQVETGLRRTASGNFKINLFSINLGMSLYL